MSEDYSNFTYSVEEEDKKQKSKEIKSSSILEDFLIDNKNNMGGRQILKIYKLLINEQNNFKKKEVKNLKKQIFESNLNQNRNQEINYLLDELDEKSSISIQNATERQILNMKQINVEFFKTIET